MNDKLAAFLKRHNIPESQEVKGSLYLSSLTSIPEGFNPTVGGSLYLSSLTSIERAKVKVNKPTQTINVFKQGEKGKGWIYADGILTHVTGIETKCGDLTFIEGKIPNMNIITDGTNWAHCDNMKSGIIDLKFKAASRDKSQYKNLTLDSAISYEDAVIMYRVITGACQGGTQAFLKSLSAELIKGNYTVREIIKITAGQWNHEELKGFFAEVEA